VIPVHLGDLAADAACDLAQLALLVGGRLIDRRDAKVKNSALHGPALAQLRYEEWHVRVDNQSILHTQNVRPKMAGFIDVPRLNFRGVFPYTRGRSVLLAALAPRRKSAQGNNRRGRPTHAFVRGFGRHLYPFEFGNARWSIGLSIGAALRIVRQTADLEERTREGSALLRVCDDQPRGVVRKEGWGSPLYQSRCHPQGR
jgi:hypothetical protein